MQFKAFVNSIFCLFYNAMLTTISGRDTKRTKKIVVLSALYIKQITNIMKYQLFMNASIALDTYRL